MTTPDGPSLSIFIITRNEADRLPRTLKAVQGLSDDIVVVDSGSTDATCDLARGSGARVVENPWPGYGPQKRFAEDQCRHTWLLNIDADEVVTPALAAEIRAAISAPDAADAYELRIAEVFPLEDAPHPTAYVLAPVRLYRKDRGRYNPSPVHDRVDMVEGARIARLKGTIHHFSVRSLGDQIAKLNAYTDQQVADLAARGRTIATLRMFTEFPLSFLRAYILRRHFTRGVYGIATAMNYAYFRWMRVAKDYERRKLAERAARQD